MLRVLLLLLVVVEEELDWGGLVSILARQDDLDAELEQVLADLLAAVVRCVVQEPVGVVAPIWRLLGEDQSQAREEHQHDIAVGVELRQAQVQLALGVQGGDHVDAMAERFVADGVALTSLPPLHATEVEVRQPRLVNVDDARALLQQLEHLLGVTHPHHQATLGVALELDLLEDPVPHAEAVSQDSPDLVDRDSQLHAFLQVGSDLLRRPDVMASLEVLPDRLHQPVVLLLLLVSLLGDGGVRVLRQPRRLDQLLNKSRLDVAELGCLDLAETLVKHELGDPLQLHAGELASLHLTPPLLLTASLEGELRR